eukprot:c25274_g2_i1 orf=228-2339(-)
MGFLAGSCQSFILKALNITVLTVVLGCLLAPPQASAQRQSVLDFVYSQCSPYNFDSSDGFARNLNTVKNSLIQNSSQFRYSLASSKTGSQESDYVYGMYECRGDISLSDCSSCVQNGLADFYTLCSGKLARGARARYKGCYLRYENFTFEIVGTEAEDSSDYEVTPNCTGSSNESSALYQQNLSTALKNSAIAAPKHPLFGYNASSEGSGSNTAYVLTQCLGYIPSLQCTACLSNLVANFKSACNGSVSGQVYLYTCYYLFSNASFLFTYNNSDAPPSPTPLPDTSKNRTSIIVGVVVGGFLVLAIIVALVLCFLKRRQKVDKSQDLLLCADKQMVTHDRSARTFSLKEMQDATDNFNPKNILGEGGFGPVYQGRLISGIEVAIKMLSPQSHQGKEEFLNEVNLITAVKHRNLIELIGCCVEGSKPLLVYEYLPKRSLNLHLFDRNNNDALDWHTRFNIIVGIARGLRYLHEESPVRIVHRDIKASNILLDNKLNPKIADFGLARLFADDMTHLTTRIVGTLRYLSPEYATSGKLTEKADVYSFGLVALEIVSGRKAVENKSIMNKENLLEWTWELYENQQQLQIMDTRMQKTRDNLSTHVSMQVNVGEVIRVVHVALLCTQLRPQERPSMFEVYNMLSGQSEILRLPTKPITISMLSPIDNRMHDDTSGILSSSTMPSYTSEPSVPLMHSYDADAISQVEPR